MSMVVISRGSLNAERQWGTVDGDVILVHRMFQRQPRMMDVFYCVHMSVSLSICRLTRTGNHRGSAWHVQ